MKQRKCKDIYYLSIDNHLSGLAWLKHQSCNKNQTSLATTQDNIASDMNQRRLKLQIYIGSAPEKPVKLHAEIQKSELTVFKMALASYQLKIEYCFVLS